MKGVKKIFITLVLLLALLPTSVFAITENDINKTGWATYSNGVLKMDGYDPIVTPLNYIAISGDKILVYNGKTTISYNKPGTNSEYDVPEFKPKEDTMGEYDKYVPNWLKQSISGASDWTAKKILIQLAVMAYDIFFIASLCFCGFKFVDAVYLSYTRAQHAITQNQLTQEILEPVKGLIYFVIGLTVIKIFLLMFFPEYSGILGLLSSNL